MKRFKNNSELRNKRLDFVCRARQERNYIGWSLWRQSWKNLKQIGLEVAGSLKSKIEAENYADNLVKRDNSSVTIARFLGSQEFKISQEQEQIIN